MVVSAMFYHPDLVGPYLSHSANLRRIMLLRDPLDRLIHAFYVAKARALTSSSHLFHPGGARGAPKSSSFAYADACELSWMDLGRGASPTRGRDDEAQLDETDEENGVGGWHEIPADAASAFHPSRERRDSIESVAFVNWLRRCPLASKGFYSDFHYLDPGNFEKLNAFIENRTRHLNKLHTAASKKRDPSAAQLQADGNNHRSGHRKHSSANANANQQLHHTHHHPRSLEARAAYLQSVIHDAQSLRRRR